MNDALEQERDFLLRSLDDLDAERDAGNIDDDTYRTLHEDYTARAAVVIRSLRDDVVPTLPEPPRASRRTKLVTVVLLVAFAGVTAFGLSRALGTRGEGETITGNSGNDDVAAGLETLRAAAESQPDNYDAHIAYARALLGDDLAGALREFDAAARIEPTQPEPPTYIGWINALAARALEPGPDRDALIARAEDSLDLAVGLDPAYQDAYVYRALLRLNVTNDPAAAIPDLQQFLRLAPPDHPMRELVNGALAEAIAVTGEPTATTTVTPSP